MSYETKTFTSSRTIYTGEPGAAPLPAIVAALSFVLLLLVIVIS